MNLQFLYCVNILLIGRLILTFNDQSIKLRQVIIISIIQLSSLIVFVNFWLLLSLGFIIIVINLLFFFWEHKKITYIYEVRLLSFISHVFVLSIFCAPPVGLTFNTDLLNFFLELSDYSVLISFAKKINWLSSHLLLLGVLVVFNESNLLIRSLFHVFRVFPGTTTESVLPKIDHREYNAGRIIGILERIIIYFAVLYNELAVIGFLMAAKGFTRFKELDQRDFAEYILIGTLLSTLMGISVGMLVRFFL